VVRAASRGDVDGLVEDYESRYELTVQAPPREVDNLRQLDLLPAVLGVFLAVVGFAALANAIVLAYVGAAVTSPSCASSATRRARPLLRF
jgi:hypothetical protein